MSAAFSSCLSASSAELESMPLCGRLAIPTVEAHFIAIKDDAKPPQLEWTPDSNVERGGYIVETPHRLVDGNLDKVLSNLYEHLTND